MADDHLAEFRCRDTVGILPCPYALGRASLGPSTKEVPMTKAPILLDPKLLGFWVRCIRETQHMSQDALAESGGLCEVAGGHVGRREGRPHISRIERRRGPVSRYGESAGAGWLWTPGSALRRGRRSKVERFEGAAAGVRAARTATAVTRSKAKEAALDRMTRRGSAPAAPWRGGVARRGGSRSGRRLSS